MDNSALEHERTMQREFLNHIREASQRIDDKYFSLATGALALSITFKGSFVPDSPNASWLLGLSWICFVCCILAYLVNRPYILNKKREYLVKWMKDSVTQGDINKLKELETGIGVAIEGFFFILAVIALASFA